MANSQFLAPLPANPYADRHRGRKVSGPLPHHPACGSAPGGSRGSLCGESRESELVEVGDWHGEGDPGGVRRVPPSPEMLRRVDRGADEDTHGHEPWICRSSALPLFDLKEPQPGVDPLVEIASRRGDLAGL